VADEIPEGLAVESVWVIEAAYAPDAAQRRAPVRREHLARVARLRAAGTIIEAGGYADMSGSLFLIRAPDEAAALAILREDVYTRAGVWTGFRARALGRVVRREELPSG
jgi:uncharacterized protein